MNKSLWLLILQIGIFVSISVTVFGQQQQQQQQQQQNQTNQEQCFINFNPQKYEGAYYVQGRFNPYKGVRTVSLPPNNAGEFYLLEIGGTGYTNSEIRFVVANNCTVRSFEKDIKKRLPVNYYYNTITFKNVLIEIEPQRFSGGYFLKGFPPSVPYSFLPSSGRLSFTMVPNVGSFIQAYGINKPDSIIHFFIEDDGIISEVSNSNAACHDGNKLIFNNIEIDLDSTNFKGNYILGYHGDVKIDAVSFKGNLKNLVVIPGIELPIRIKDNTPDSYVIPSSTGIQPASIDLLDNENRNHKFLFNLSK